MSNEAFQMIRALDRSRLESQIALQCAPVLTGVKISNLLTLSRSQKEEAAKFFQGTCFSLYVLYQSQEKITFLVYRRNALVTYLSRPKVRELMAAFGYSDLSLNRMFASIAAGYSDYICFKKPFPHEIGLVLGYPPEDVEGFINNQGKNFLYSGYWKVYGDLGESMKAFRRYDQAKEYMIRVVSKGGHVRDLLQRRAAYA